MHKVHALLPLALIVSLSELTYTPKAVAEDVMCSNSPTRVHSTTDVEIVDVCEAAADAIAFLSAIGLQADQQIIVNIVEKLPVRIPGDPIGCFDRIRREIFLMDKASCMASHQRSNLFDLDFSTEYYRGIVTHEVAHSVVSSIYPEDSLSWVAQEYVAYVTQLATFSTATRRRVLARYSGDGFDTPQQINSYVLLASPSFFAVSAYQHFTKAENGSRFILSMLAGEIQLGDDLAPRED